ncbi:hypothetical protein BT63DRAFT_426102 [Microthyrium microscopicum]|uniref:Uncharacterized protein n=1 Tax=Microthyrium microscopicum TaxID=703497 RepID=A0A6A6UBK8_9PEZI|nr:hypothetical protein BT63DRAFT_426102 [Microthyrium microscopicum]
MRVDKLAISQPAIDRTYFMPIVDSLIRCVSARGYKLIFADINRDTIQPRTC